MDSFREYYLRITLNLGTESLEKKLAEAVEFAKRGHGYSIMPWEEVKMEIEKELATRSGIGLELGGTDIATKIWQARDEQ